MSRYGETKLYVGDLGNNASKPEIEDAFSYYGAIRNVWVARNPPGFAFVEFEDARDAEDAIRGLDGRTICGRRARVEYSNGRRGGPPSRRGGARSDDRCYDCGGRGHYARDCRRRRRSRSRGRRRSRSASRSRSRSGSRSRSRSRSARTRSRSPRSKTRSPSKSPKD